MIRSRKDSGTALVVALLIMLIVALMGTGLVISSQGGTRVENNLRWQASALQTADGGIDRALEQIRVLWAGGQSLSTMLAGNAPLVDSTRQANFGPTTSGVVNGTSPLSPAIVPGNTTLLAPGAFQVFLSNDPDESAPGCGVTASERVRCATDANSRVTLTSFASGPNEVGFATVQAVVELPLAGFPGFAATLFLPGPDVDFTPNNAMTYNITNTPSPNCVTTIGVSSPAARQKVIDRLGARLPNYRTCDPGGGPNLIGASTIRDLIQSDASNRNPYDRDTNWAPNDPSPLPRVSRNLVTVSYYVNELLPAIRDIARFRSTSDPGFNWGTTAAPEIIYIEGDAVVPSSGGAGILLVTGDLAISGSANWTGLILAIGNGKVAILGDGNGRLSGAMLIANTREPWFYDPRYVGVPRFVGNEGGNASWGFSSAQMTAPPATRRVPPRRISFQQLR